MKNCYINIIIVILFTAISINTLAYEITVYSARKERLIKPLFDEFTKETNIKVKYITAKAGALIERLKLEGKNTPADVLLTVDAGNLWYAKDEDLLATINSPYLHSTIAPYLKDIDNKWVGLSIRARTIVYNSERVQASELSNYSDLAQPKWHKRLCLRTAKKIYNKSLVASLIYNKGKKQAKNIVRGWVANLATKPYAKDSQVMSAILSGQCDVGLVNTYYFAQLFAKDKKTPLKLLWANQNTTGTHINVSGAGIIKHSNNKHNAQKLIEWLTFAKAQNIYAQLNYEYPANQNIAPSDIIASFGNFRHDKMNLVHLGILQQEATKMMQELGYY